MIVEKRNEIQWLRAVAAVEVIIWHSDLLTKHFSTNLISGSFYKPAGGFGVELYFVISGYVICMISPLYPSWRDFILSRILRLYPMYWIFTTLVIIAYLINPRWGRFNPDLLHILKSYAILPQADYPVLGVGWTLEHEMVFYGLVSVVISITGLTTRSKLVLAWSCLALGWLGYVLAPGAVEFVSVSHILSPFMFAFGFGWLVRWIEETGGRGGWAFAVLGAVFATGFWLGDAADRLLLLRIAGAAFVFAVFVVLRSVFSRNNALNRLVWKVGDASFSIYLVHGFLLSIGGKILSLAPPPPEAELLARVVGVLFCVAVGVWIFDAIEKPIDRWLRPRPKDAKQRVVSAGAISTCAGTRS
jgi:peptidoglycan/LPS O-acetylase OafA/YrhL